MGAMADFHKRTGHVNCCCQGYGALLHLEGWDKTPLMGLEAKSGKVSLVKSTINRKRHRGGAAKSLESIKGTKVIP